LTSFGNFTLNVLFTKLSISVKKGTKVDIDIPDFVTRLNRLLYTARVSGVDFGLDVKTLTGPKICLSSLIEYGLPYFGI
jgi:hypothetical protein